MKTTLSLKTTVAHALYKRWLFAGLFLIGFSGIGFSQQTLKVINGWNAYVHLPDDYNTTGTQTYPAILFFPGTGQVGTDASQLNVYGPGNFLASGWNGYVTTTSGAIVKPIIISLQPPALWPVVSAVDGCIQAIKTLYRVDPKRISLTGLSQGGWISEMYVQANPAAIASVVAMTAVVPSDNPAYPAPFINYAQDCGHWLGYEQINDFRDMANIANTMNGAVSGSAVYFQTNVGGGGHCCWNTWYDPTHTDNYTINGVTGNWNIYTFMVSYSGCTAGTPPTVGAGTQQTITLPVNNSSLSGTATGNGGATISSTAWTEVSGPVTATITTPGGLSTTVTGLTTAGTYVFKLTATDNNTLTASNTQTVVVNAAAPNVPPTVTAGTQQTITLPVSNSSLSGTATGNGGATISSTAWTEVSGPVTATITTPGGLSTTVTGLTTAGTYVFKLTATDNNTLTASNTQTVVVNAAAPNVPPTVTAGTQQTITLPVSNSSLSGTATGNGGATISSTAWTEVSGPVTATITTPGGLSTTVTGLTTAGTYVFKLTATDNNTLTASNTQTVVVNAAAPNVPPTVTAGTQQTITLPVSNSSLSGTATGNGGATISSTAWTEVSGPVTATITTPGGLSTTVTGLTTAGTYVFKLTATDNNTLTASNTQTVVVNAAAPNVPPTVTAGTQQTITLPVSNSSLSGTATGNGGATISSTAWTEVSGPVTATITTPGGLSTTVTGLTTAGTYVFKLTATDNNTLTASNTQTVVVNAAAPNVPPTVTAGTQQTITLPVNNSSLSGTATGNGGATISSTAWTEVSGGAATITTAGSLTTTVTGLTQGAYVFILTATDNNGLTATATQTVVVNAPAPVPPTVTAGTQQTITLPVSTANLSGSATGNNGATISTTAWTEVSGPAATITSSGSLTTTVTGLTQGTYVFILTATDNNGLTATATQTVVVNAAPNIPPSADAGSLQSITLPVSTANLSGTATGNGGATISSTVWTQVSGPVTATITTAGSLTTTVTGLTTAGSYLFKLTATDNNGLTAGSNVTITVNPAPTAPTVSAGNNVSITLPTNSVTLTGVAAGTNGATISTTSWSETSGGAATIVSASNLSTSIGGLTQGTYIFTLTVTDNNGLTNASTVTVTVYGVGNSCGCDFILTPPATDGQVYLDGSVLGVKPGNKVCLASAHYVSIFLYNFYGAPGNPITIVNCGGPVTISGYNSYGFIMSHSWYVHISGAGDPATKYGITIDGGPASTSYGYSENGHVRDIEVDHFEVKNIAGVGMGCAPTPSCDSTTWSTSWKMYNISFHDNYVHDTQGEGYYIGNTQYDYDYTCSGVDIDVHPQQIDSVKFYNNIIDKAGWTAAQISQVTGGVDIHDNLVTNYGYLNKPQHQAGIIVGEFSHGSVYRNKIIGGTGDAFQCFGSGTTLVYNNIFANAGYDGTAQGQPTIFADDRPLPVGYPGLQLHILNNTIVAPARNAISFYNDYGTVQNNNLIANNIITAPGLLATIPAAAYYDLQANPHAVTSNNLTVATSDIPKFLNLAGNDYHLLLGSPAIDAGMNVSSYGVTSDIEGNARPYGTAYDIGAYEYTGAPPPLIANAGGNQVVTLPQSTTMLDGSKSVDPAGTILTYTWTQLSGPNTAVSGTPSAVSSPLSNLVQGTYQFKLVITDTRGLTAADSMTLVVNAALPNQPPVANAGANQSVTLPVNSVILNGNGSTDASGTITVYNWIQLSGPNTATIANAAAGSTTASNLVQGIYQFKLVVTDNNGLSASAVVTIQVNAAVAPPPAGPVANAGGDQTITLPVSTITLNGSNSTDAGGTIVSYTWTELSGPNTATAANPGVVSSTVSNLQAGTYQFRLTVTDNNGASASDVMTVVVNAAVTPPASNQPPVAVPGQDQNLPGPAIVALNGSASYDPDGTIVSYSWVITSGAGGVTIVNSGTATPTVYGLKSGTYTFQLTVTDNSGASASASTTVTVGTGASAQALVAVAGSDTTLSYPASEAVLDGSASYDVNGSIASYSWRQITGAGTSSITQPNGSVTNVSQLHIGVYTFELTVTDNNNLTARDTVKVTVLDNSRHTNVLGVYPNPAIDNVTITALNDYLGKAKVSIYGLGGQIVGSMEFEKQSSSFSQTISVGRLSRGPYIIVIQFAGAPKPEVVRLIKQ